MGLEGSQNAIYSAVFEVAKGKGSERWLESIEVSGGRLRYLFPQNSSIA